MHVSYPIAQIVGGGFISVWGSCHRDRHTAYPNSITKCHDWMMIFSSSLCEYFVHALGPICTSNRAWDDITNYDGV